MSVQHIAFGCRDIYKQEEFYGRHFGFKRARTFKPGQPGEFIMLRKDNTCLEFFKADEAEGLSGGEQKVGFRHLAFEVENIEKLLPALKADGIEPDPVIDCAKHCEGMFVCFFNDPEGNRVELVQGYVDEE